MKSGNLNFLEPCGPLQASKRTALPLPLYEILRKVIKETTKQYTTVDLTVKYNTK
jgi:hypothetical protein